MLTERSNQGAAFAQLERLEPRLLLSSVSILEASILTIDSGPACSLVPVTPEAESNGGSANDDLGSAQELDFTTVTPGSGPMRDAGIEQVVVHGTADGIGGEVYENTVTIYGSIAYPNSYSWNFRDAVAPSGAGTLTISAIADLGGTSKYLTLEAEGIALGDLFVDDGQSGGFVTTQVNLTQDQLTTLAEDGSISVRFTPSADVARIGMGRVTMQLSYGAGGSGTGDFYRVDLGAGESLSAAVVGSASSQLDLQLLDADGAVLADGASGYENVSTAIGNYSAQQAGTYYLRVGGEGDYDLVVNRNAAMDLEGNDAFDSAVPIESAVVDGYQWSLGYVGGDTTLIADSDIYAVSVTSGNLLKVRAYDLGADNLLAISVSIYDSDGNLVASGVDTNVVYRVPGDSDGTYYVEVDSANGTAGEYALSVEDFTPGRKGKGPPDHANSPRSAGKAVKEPAGLSIAFGLI